MRIILLITFLIIAVSTQALAQTPNFGWAKQAFGQDLGLSDEFGTAIALDAQGNSYVTGYFKDTIAFDALTLTSSGSYDIFVAKYDAAGNALWARKAGGTGDDRGTAIAVDAGGNCYVSGIFRNTATFLGSPNIMLTSSGLDDIFIAKYDASGNLILAKRAGGTSYDQGTGIGVDGTGNIYSYGYISSGTVSFGGSVTLSTNGFYDAFLAKYDASGNILWAKKAGGTSMDYGYGIAVDGSGNSYVTGSFSGTATFTGSPNISLTSNGDNDIFIAKYNTSGNVIWAKKAGSSGFDEGLAIAIDGNGNSYVTGYFKSTATFYGATNITLSGSTYSDIFIAKFDASGNALWAKMGIGALLDYGNSIAVDGSGNSYITGKFTGSTIFSGNPHITLAANGTDDAFVAKYDGSGNLLWAKQAGGPGKDNGNGIAVDATGNSMITGNFTGTATFASPAVTLSTNATNDIFIARFDSSGNPVWVKGAGGITSKDSGRAIARDGQGNLYVTGYFMGSTRFETTTLVSNGLTDIFLAKYDPLGNLLWVKQMGGSGYDEGYGIAVDGVGNSFVTGSFSGTAAFYGSPNITLTSNGNSDIFVARYDAAGNLVWAKQAGGTAFDAGKGVAVDGSGNCYVTGNFPGTATFYGSPNISLTSNGGNDIFLAKYSPSGNVLWAKKAGGNNLDMARAIALDASGNSYLTGLFTGTATFYGSPDVVLSGIGYWDLFVAKYDATGNVVWARKAQGSGLDYANGIAVDGTGSSYITGSFQNSFTFSGGANTTLNSSGGDDAFIAKYNSGGILLWAKKAGGTGNDAGNAIALDGSGNLYITGQFQNSATFTGAGNLILNSIGNSDIFVSKYDGFGNAIWVKQAGGTGEDIGHGIVLDGYGNNYLTGSFQHTVNFDNTNLAAHQFEFFVARLGGSGTQLSTNEFTPAENEREIRLFPNPASGILNLQMLPKGLVQVIVYNSIGQAVLKRNTTEPVNDGNLQLDLSNQPKGVYSIRLVTESQNITRKVVLQ